jgi:formate hydrogenlyase transcriptional activator
LQNLVERSVILSTGAVLNGSAPELTYTPKSSAPITLEEAERSHILETLLRTAGVVGGPNGAAACLGLKRTTLISMMRRLGINPGRTFTAAQRAGALVA